MHWFVNFRQPHLSDPKIKMYIPVVRSRSDRMHRGKDRCGGEQESSVDRGASAQESIRSRRDHE